MNLRDLWDYLYLYPSNKWREIIDELEAKGEISSLIAYDVHSHLDDWANEAYKREKENQI